jgi:hypothetical protein
VELPLRVSEVRDLTLEDCRLEQSGLPTALLIVEAAERVSISRSVLSSHFMQLERLLRDFPALQLDRILAQPDPATRVKLLATRLFEIEKPVAGDVLNRITEFGLSQLAIDPQQQRSLREDATRLQREVISAQPQANKEERLRTVNAAITVLSQVLFSAALVITDTRADVTLDQCHLLGRVHLYGGGRQVMPLAQLQEQGRRMVSNGLNLGPLQGEFRAVGCRFVLLLVDVEALGLIVQNDWRDVYRSCYLAGNELIGGSGNMLLAGHVTLEGNRLASATSGRAALVAICESATVVGNSGPTKATLPIAVPGGVASGLVQQAANHVQVVNP